MFKRLSIRWRITLGSVAFAILLFGATLVVVRLEISSILMSSNQSLAAGDLTSFAAEIRNNPDGLVDDSAKGSLVYIRNPQGRVELDTMPHDIRETLEHRLGGNEDFVAAGEGSDFVLVGKTVTTPEGTWSLWAARSEAASQFAMERLDHGLIVGAGALVILFGAASWLLASAALRPVSRMRMQAENLSATEGAVDLPLGEANDEIAALAATLNAFLERVRRSNTREKQMVSDAAHELRTPLAALKTQLELAHRDFADPAALPAQIVTAQRSVDRLSSLASNLLALSRTESAEAKLEPTSADELVSEAMEGVDRTRLLALAKGIDVSFSAVTREPAAMFPISAGDFGRIVDNLAGNAIAAAGDSGAIEITLTQTDDTLALSIADDGPGMPDPFIPRAFDRFSRADASRTGDGGAGLGLALVKAIVDAAGGTVTLTNAHPGLIAEVRLPNM
ncbi:sensor histidine kinase [Lacisediminihabitans changchengi]|uniref:histidine kinase n=1 Tax=Lacisediminihabitans changchengi TaxID=2787634 RepID=A0A934SM48_9MICO|nr:HAMP domain-containing sensor histidine kinase [Lacisediminihabitans changchengi]MBK4346987.1 HAMP domain-containing histidine kinase [Lacisediminihabitans changchengi]MBK4347890.1 HAMP domain-containing histidine kinase [Lacisediminihabitans changchengi]